MAGKKKAAKAKPEGYWEREKRISAARRDSSPAVQAARARLWKAQQMEEAVRGERSNRGRFGEMIFGGTGTMVPRQRAEKAFLKAVREDRAAKKAVKKAAKKKSE